MRQITKLLIEESCLAELARHGLEKAWKKAKEYVLAGHLDAIDFRKRRPYDEEKYYFRLTQKYRAHCYFHDDETLHVYWIDDHQ